MDKQTDKILQERIEKFNQWVMNADLKRIPIGLYHGKMGLCIYFYELAHLVSEKKYNVFAKKLLDNIVNEVTENIIIDLENGLTGICFAINYLFNKRYITGNSNHVLKELNDKIIQELLFNRILNERGLSLTSINSLLSNLMYLTIRLQNTKLSKGEKQIMQNVIIENINKIESFETEKFTEPTFFSLTEYFTSRYLNLLPRISKLHFYDYKIEKIVEGLSPNILYRYPLNKANRLSLYLAMNEIVSNYGNIKGWKEHIELLQQHLDISQTINEFRNKNVMFFDGLCGFYYLLKKVGQDNKYKDSVLDKISCSGIWNQLPEKEDTIYAPIGLYDGLSGVFLTYLHISHRSNYNIFFDYVINQYV